MFANGASSSAYQIKRSLRFKPATSSRLSRTLITPTNNKIWTWSGWVKRSAFGAAQALIGTTDDNLSSANVSVLRFLSGDQLEYFDYSSSYITRIQSTAMYRDPTAWLHVVLAVDTTQVTNTNRIKLYVNGSLITALSQNTYPTLNYNTYINSSRITYIGAYNNVGSGITAPTEGYLAEINFVDGQALDPSSFGNISPLTGSWVAKAYAGTYGVNGFYLNFSNATSTTTLCADMRQGAYSQNLRTQGTPIGAFTGNGGLAAAFDGIQEQDYTFCANSPVPAAGYTNASALGKDWGIGITRTLTALRLFVPNSGSVVGGTSTPILFKLQGSTNGSSWTDLMTPVSTSGAASEIVSVTTGIDTSIAYRYHRIIFNANGVNNLYVGELEFFETGPYALGSNNWTPSGISVTPGINYDSMRDAPLGGGGDECGNYSTLNPLDSRGFTIAEGALKFFDGAGATYQAYSTIVNPDISISTGYYCEVVAEQGYAVGIAPETKEAVPAVTDRTGFLGYYPNTGNKYNNTTATAYGATVATNDIIGIKMGNGGIEFFKNGVSQGVAFTGLTGAYKFGVWAAGSTGQGVHFNFGQRPFSYTPPVGFKPLHTGNLSTPSINQPNRQFDVVLYTGDATPTRNITSLPFQPDFIWNKQRNGTFSHILVDSVRGGSPGLAALQSNATDAEYTTLGSGGGISSILSNGFVVSAGSVSNINLNGAGQTYVNWAWKANGAAITNTAGTITSQVSANTQAGFSIVTYTGTGANATVGHGLGIAPKFIIIKSRSLAGSNWPSYHVSTGNLGYNYLNLTNTVFTNASYWNSTTPASTVFSLGNDGANNQAGQTFVAYCFTEIPGFSKISSYTGNGSTNGPFIHCGFRPKYLLVKRTDVADRWGILNAASSPYNEIVLELHANNNDIEGGAGQVDFLANGFKLRSNNSVFNSTSGNYIFYAIAETPFKYSNAR